MSRRQREAIYYVLTVTGIYLGSFLVGIRMLRELFDEFSISYAGIGWILLLALGGQGWNAASAWIPDRVHRMGKLMLTGFMIIWALGYGIHHMTELTGGGTYLAQRYIGKWNQYYNTNLYLGTGDPYNYQMTLTFVVVCLYLLATLVGMWWRRNGLAVLFPSLVVALIMLVGYTPGWLSVMLWIICVVLVHNRSWQKENGGYRSVVQTILLFLIIGGGTGLLCQAPAGKVIEKEHEMLALQHRIEKSITSVGFAGFFAGIDNSVDNHTPNYSGTENLEVTVDMVMTDNLYLRGSYGIAYENRRWTQPEEEFEQACAKEGLDSKEVAMTLAELPFHVQSMMAGADEPETAQFDIHYTGIIGSTVYLPYGMDVVSAEDPLEITDDFLLQKPWGQEQLQVKGMALTEYPLYGQNAMYELYGYMPINAWPKDDSALLDELSENDRIFADFYNKYVQQHYMEVPDNQPAVTDAVAALEATRGVKLSQKYEQGEKAYVVNFGRIMLAEMVREYLAEREDYSLELDSIDSDTDPIEYFPGKSHQGYCVHFASAGVLILRQLGVPCRYASGYVARSSRFVQQGSQYTASVLDSNAHAWVEVYLDDYGWLPFEMTDGYSSDNRGFGETIRSARRKLNQNLELITDDRLEQHSQTPDKDMSNETTSDAQGGENSSSQNAASQNLGDTENRGTGDGTQQSTLGSDADAAGKEDTAKTDRIRRAMARIAGILAVLMLLVLAVKLYKKNQESVNARRISRGLRRGKYSGVVRRVNHMVYGRLRGKRHHIHMRLDDEHYYKALVDAYPQIAPMEWEHYMLLVRRAAYSRSELTQEEAVYVLGIAHRMGKQN